MGVGSIGIPSLILIIVVALLIFGPSKLPEIGKAAGSSLREFKDATKGLMGENEKDEEEKEAAKTTETAKTTSAKDNQE